MKSLEPPFTNSISSLRNLHINTMSFLGGAECSTAGNPLSQFSKHVQDDKSLQRDRMVGRGPGGMQEGMRRQMQSGGADGVRLSWIVTYKRADTTVANTL